MAELGFLLPPQRATAAGSTTVHAAPMTDVPVPGGGTFRYPSLTALCGVRGWGQTSGPVTCKRCLRCMSIKGGESDV